MSIGSEVQLSVILPSYNPDASRINAVLQALKVQSLPHSNWELIIIDNGSVNGVIQQLDLSWHPRASVITESKQGLTHSRLAGFKAASGNIIVMVDDDNLLDTRYLENAAAILVANRALGAVGGKSLPLFEVTPPYWLTEFNSNIALRDLGGFVLTSKWSCIYPNDAPIGAGMAIRKEALKNYIDKIDNSTKLITDRTGGSLTSGGDNDIVLEILKSGWLTGYYPQLSLQHIIPAARMQRDYVARLVNQTNKSWVQVLADHQINPWKKIPAWTLPLRKMKAWLHYRAWRSPAHYIRWQGACGLFEGQATLPAQQ